ncbi:MAG: hypothetical protein K2K12_01245 [Clostridia bacterium]|nr:hypothetical protein [Clostridia bacterium]
MEFFDWVQIPWMIAEYMNLSVNSAEEAVSVLLKIMQISVGVAAALYLTGLICGGIGLMKMAKRQNISYWWLGFLPFGNTYLIGKLAGETRMFGKQSKRIGLYAMAAEILYVLIEVVLLIITFMLTRVDFYGVDATGAYAFIPEKMWEGYGWVVTLQTALEITSYILWFITFFLMCSLYNAFFRKYYARSPFMMTFLCAVFPLKGYVLLAVRNNTPVDYTAYQQQRYEEMRRQQEQQYGGYEGGNRPFDFGGSYGNADDPFSEFDSNDNQNNSGGSSNDLGGSSSGGSSPNGSSSGGSPFSDF